MSQATRAEANEDSESDSTTSSSTRLSTSGTGCCTNSSSKTLASNDSSTAATSSGSGEQIDDDHDHSNGRGSMNLHEPSCNAPGSRNLILGEPSSSCSSSSLLPSVSTSATRVTNETEESNILKNKSDEVIQRSQQETGRKCDTKTTTATTVAPNATSTTNKARYSTKEHASCLFRSGPGRPTSMVVGGNQVKYAQQQQVAKALNSHLYPSTSDCAQDRPTTASFSDIRQASLKNSSIVSPSALSSLNISTPLDRLSECDAITKRLMSSPIRTVNLSERPMRRSQMSEVDKSRRASLGTKSIAEQVSLFASNQFNSLELGYAPRGTPDNCSGDPNDKYARRKASDSDALVGVAGSSVSGQTSRGGVSGVGSDLRLKQQQVRSLSVCQEETLKPRFRNNNSNHSSNLNRAVSLACESGSSKRLLTIIPLFGCDMKALEQYMKLGLIFPPPINSAIDHILVHGIDAIGIFRKSGVKSRILTLKQRIENNQDARVDEINVENEFSIYDIADLVKMWFRELKPSPIMTRELIKMIAHFLQTNGLLEEDTKNSSHQLKRDKSSTSTSSASMQEMSFRLMQQINSTISPAHKVLISRAMSFFATISSKSDINQMTSQNLAICLTPSLCATETDQASILLAQRALKYSIDNPELWAGPS